MRLRAGLRALHRDVGYLLVGLTFVYALSGLAVNHIADWDPNFREVHHEATIALPLPGDDAALAAAVAGAFAGELALAAAPREIYREDPAALELVWDDVTVRIDPTTGAATAEGQRARWFLRVSNWLHLNRGKKAWTWIADGYAILLLFLATSGMFMLPGRKGLRGRAAILVPLGAAAPITYVVLSGGP